jgi:hypothetical protein
MRTAHVERLTYACFLLVAVVASGVLLSWWFDLGDLTLPGRVARPMAPATAALFLLVVVATWRRDVRSESTRLNSSHPSRSRMPSSA